MSSCFITEPNIIIDGSEDDNNEPFKLPDDWRINDVLPPPPRFTIATDAEKVFNEEDLETDLMIFRSSDKFNNLSVKGCSFKSVFIFISFIF